MTKATHGQTREDWKAEDVRASWVRWDPSPRGSKMVLRNSEHTQSPGMWLPSARGCAELA